ncbi:oxidoreductase [Bowdeniella nasicola]|uniref:Oxidoreductase n=1 Tax=Bowdeniella nasicola TaxID=208480 RepID=A0A1Q5Q0W0_9ACTO|nr:NADH:flavin oxidoreductase/NADH oxidase [Bowdeniella nasicola]OKL53365.1 oxidoreductase [Bowdeniella nasicola]
MALVLSPVRLRKLLVRNRIWLAPMCMYSCENRDGVVTDWHLVHLGARATGGFGLIMTEASSVTPEGRISPHDAGIWNDEQAAAWKPIVDFAHAHGAAICMQLAHAGRKASTHRPFPGEISGVVSEHNGGWDVIGPSPVRFPGLKNPLEMTESDIDEVIEAFAAAAERAIEVGFDAVEIHAAHGYLLHSFLSPLSNQRTDQWGGSFDNRVRILLDVLSAVRDRVGMEIPVLVRISGTDWVEDGWQVEDSARLAPLLAELGCDFIDVSSGGNMPVEIPVGPGYQVPSAAAVRKALREGGHETLVGAVGLITETKQAEEILQRGDADVIFLGRVALREPTWPLRAQFELADQDMAGSTRWPAQYLRGAWR